MAPERARGGSPDGMCTAGGRVREGKPSLVRTGVNVVQDAGRGAADLNAPRIPPGPVRRQQGQLQWHDQSKNI